MKYQHLITFLLDKPNGQYTNIILPTKNAIPTVKEFNDFTKINEGKLGVSWVVINIITCKV